MRIDYIAFIIIISLLEVTKILDDVCEKEGYVIGTIESGINSTTIEEKYRYLKKALSLLLEINEKDF